MGVFSDAVANAILNSIEATIGTAPTIEFRSGPPPATAATADSGTLLATGALPSDWLADAAGRVKSKTATDWAVTASANGLVGHVRIKASTTTHLNLVAAMPYAASTPVVVGQQMVTGGNAYRCTTAGTTGAASAPTGTGTGIADGTAVWAYVDPNNFTIVNVSVATGQPITVTSFSINAEPA